MATRFKPLKLTSPDLFGVRVHGAFGRGDRQRLLDLGKRCLGEGQLRLVFDCTDLDSLGGSGAGVLADLQSQLVERGGEAVFVAAGPVIQRFLTRKFEDLPLRFYDDLEEACSGFAGVAQPGAGIAPSPSTTTPERVVNDREGGLDALLGEYTAEDSELSKLAARTADLVTAAYVSLDDVLMAAGEAGNSTALSEAIAILLESHDLAADTQACLRDGDHFVSADSSLRIPVDGGIASSLERSRRPLTMLDIEDSELWDEEIQFLEKQQPDLILPLIQYDSLRGVVFLHRGGEDREYTLAEVFALELLQRLLGLPSAAGIEPTASTPPPSSATDELLVVKMDLVRGLQDAQDIAHFWQIFLTRLRGVAEVSSLLYHDVQDGTQRPFIAGEARRHPEDIDLDNERLHVFFRTLERPVEIANMPASFTAVRDELTVRGLRWLVALRVDGECLGVLAFGLTWRDGVQGSTDQLQDVIEITAEALQRLRGNQRRANMSLGLLETLIVGEDSDDDVTRQTVQAVRCLARELGLPPDQERDLVLGTLVRNIGQSNTTVSDLGADHLSGEQWETFRAHAELGDKRMADLDAPQAVRQAVRHHHERYDGRGFPLGLTGRDIPLVARLVAVAQYHALQASRTTPDKAREAVLLEAGKSLDPDLVEIFTKAMRRDAGHDSSPKVSPAAAKEPTLV